MDKRSLRKIPMPDSIPATAVYKQNERLIKTEYRQVNGEELLILDFYKQAEGEQCLTCCQRTFLTPADYITLEIDGAKTKWKTGAFHNDWHFNTLSKQFVSMEHLERLKGFLTGYKTRKEYKRNPDIWDDFEEYQLKILASRLKKKHESELAQIGRQMSILKDVPKEFFQWVIDDALKKSQYIIYRPATGKKNVVQCQCTVCKEIFEEKREIIGAKENAESECPKCSSPVTFKTYGHFPKNKYDRLYATYIEPTPEGFCARYFHIQRTFVKELTGVKLKSDEFYEIVREFVRYESEGPVIRGYQYDYYKNTHVLRWCNEREHNTLYGGTTLYDCYNSCLYPGNLPEAWEHTPMKYSGLEFLSRGTPGWPARYWDVIKNPGAYRATEILAKAGLCTMAHNTIEYGFCSNGEGLVLDLEAKDLKSVLRMNRKDEPNMKNIRVLRQIDASVGQLALVRHMQRLGVPVKPDEVLRFYNIFEVNSNVLARRKASVHKICRYIEKQQEKEKRKKIQDIGSDWIDYIDMCRALNKNLNDDFWYFPPNFREAHDRVSEEYKAYQDAKAAEEKRLREMEAEKRMLLAKEAMKEIFQENDGVDAFHIKGKGLILVVPKDAQDIRAEGEALHHCVGNYVGRVAKGETNIFFVRKQEEPDIPFFTMEFRDGHVVQCRGLRNCSMPPNVEGFTKAFEAKMNAAQKGVNRNAG